MNFMYFINFANLAKELNMSYSAVRLLFMNYQLAKFFIRQRDKKHSKKIVSGALLNKTSIKITRNLLFSKRNDYLTDFDNFIHRLKKGEIESAIDVTKRFKNAKKFNE